MICVFRISYFFAYWGMTIGLRQGSASSVEGNWKAPVIDPVLWALALSPGSTQLLSLNFM